MQRSQHLTQADPRVFGVSYVANCSSVDGVGAFFGEKLDHRHIEYFQGLERFHEQDLPNKLSVNRRESLTVPSKTKTRIFPLLIFFVTSD